jgi:hypothetical protein
VKRERTETVQTAVRLPRDMHERLKQSPDGVSDEIRRRLEQSFAHDAAKEAQDPKTRELADDVTWLADAITRQVRPEGDPRWVWHSTEATHAALAEALRTWMDIIKPLSGLLSPDPSTLGLLGPGDPATLGRATAWHLQRIKAALQPSGGFNALSGVLGPVGGSGLLSPERNKEKKS